MRASHFEWRRAILNLCPDMDPVELVKQYWTEVGKDTAAINERTKHMPTKADMIAGIQSHAVKCAANRRWKWGLWVAVPGGVAALWGLWTAFSGG